jgi:hypothetical protein
MNITTKDLNRLLGRQAIEKLDAEPKPKGRQPNKWERLYADRLRVLVAAGEIHEFGYETVTLKLANDCRYTPDFWVVLPNGKVEAHEVKGHMRAVARTKLAVAVKQFRSWLPIYLATRPNGDWKVERLLPEEQP